MKHFPRSRKCLLVVAVLAAAEIGLQMGRPSFLDRIRDRTFLVDSVDQDFITLQPINFDNVTNEPLLLFDWDLFWRPAPDRQGSFFLTAEVATNEHGFRSDPRPKRKSGDEKRLWCLGDSVTFGFGVAAAARFSDRTVAGLNEREPESDWRSVNNGVIGYSSFQGRRFLKSTWQDVDPDYVICAFGINDCILNPCSDSEFSAILDGLPSKCWQVFRRSQVFCLSEGLIAFAVRAVDSLRLPDRRSVSRYLYYPRFPAVPPETPRCDPRTFMEQMESIRALCIEKNVPLLVLIPFVAPQVDSTNPIDKGYFKRLNRLRTVLIGWAKGNEVPYVDPRRIFLDSGIPLPQLMIDFCHPTGEGHSVIAQKLIEKIHKPL